MSALNAAAVNRSFSTQKNPLWSKAIATPAVEFDPVPLRIISGAIPTGLRGSLYRNGPGRLERGGERIPHWFDGDGGILAVHFNDGGATGLYRYVRTAGWLAEEKAGRYLYSGYGQLAPGPFWKRWGSQPKHVANTSVLALEDKLLALWEGDRPYVLDPENLQTLGLDDLGGLETGQPYSAHPKCDPQTGEIYNFGISYGKTLALNLYRSDSRGQVKQKAQIPLDRFSVIHDFGFAGPYLIFLIPPLQAQVLPLLLGLKSFSDAFRWQPQLGTQILVIDRQTMQLVQKVETDPWYQWHIGNSYVEADGTVVVDYVRYSDWSTNQWLAEVVSGCPTTEAEGLLWRLRLQPQQGKVLEQDQLLNLNVEFPLVTNADVGQKARYLYLSSHDQPDSDPKEMFNSLARFELETGAVTLARSGAGCYPMEPIPVHDRDNPSQIWLLTVVYDGNRHQSTVQIYDAAHLEAGSVCVLALPEVIPFGFHGTWRPA